MVKGIFRSRGWAYTISARDPDVLLGGYNFIKKCMFVQVRLANEIEFVQVRLRCLSK
jgi:hypothetical protein